MHDSMLRRILTPTCRRSRRSRSSWSYRVAQEALTNAVRHADAGVIRFSLCRGADEVVLVVQDDGRGFDPARASPASGIRGMRERALLVRARLEVDSAPGRGTVVTLRNPAVSVPLKIRLLLADDHVLVRQGLRMVLDAAPDLEVAAEASDGAEAVELALREERLHLAVLDVAMPRMTGLQAAAELSRRRPELKLLMLSMHESEQYLFEALRAGASGYVLKTAADRDLVEAVRAAMRGEPFLHPAAVTALIRDYLARRRLRPIRSLPRARGAQADRRGVHERSDRAGTVDQPPHG